MTMDISMDNMVTLMDQKIDTNVYQDRKIMWLLPILFLLVLVVGISKLKYFYSHFQYLNPLIGDLKSQIMTVLTYFDVVMCLWSYFQTFRIDSHV
jgi:membrane protein YdbS with pleckstrin-like domain